MPPNAAGHAQRVQPQTWERGTGARLRTHQGVDADARARSEAVLQVGGQLRRGSHARAHEAPLAAELLLSLQEIAAVGPQQRLGGGHHHGAGGSLRARGAARATSARRSRAHGVWGARREARDELAALEARGGVFALVRILRRHHVGLHAGSLLRSQRRAQRAAARRGGRCTHHLLAQARKPLVRRRRSRAFAATLRRGHRQSTRARRSRRHGGEAPLSRARALSSPRAAATRAGDAATHRAGCANQLATERATLQRRAARRGRGAGAAPGKQAGVSAHSNRQSRASRVATHQRPRGPPSVACVSGS